ncbi:MAG: hypothetical protein R3E08_01970 [Thiotrichaceae bacterium]
MLQDDKFLEAEVEWDLSRLYKDLAIAKGKGKSKSLTPIEKLHVRGLLCGYSPIEIADKLHKDPDGLKVDLSNRVYQYVKGVLGKEEENVGNWRNIREWLEEAGYRQPINHTSFTIDSLPIDAAVKITNINRSRVMIEVNMRFTAPLSPTNREKFDDDQDVQNKD